MGNLVWHKYARLVSLTASVYAVWAAFWGLIYRKFFWDFVNGTLRDPGGIQPAPKDEVFVSLIVHAPIVQVITILLGIFMIALELPLPHFKSLSIYRSIVLRIVLLLFQSFFTVLFYQGTNAAIWSLISLLCYIRAQVLGETLEDAKCREKGGVA